jgi:anti-sigma B factor antagonist
LVESTPRGKYMTLKASIHTDSAGNYTIQMRGNLNYENNDYLSAEVKTLLFKNPDSKITLDLYFLDFVGSSGISNFVRFVNELNQPSVRVFLSNVKSEFIKVFKLYEIWEVEKVITDYYAPLSEPEPEQN